MSRHGRSNPDAGVTAGDGADLTAIADVAPVSGSVPETPSLQIVRDRRLPPERDPATPRRRQPSLGTTTTLVRVTKSCQARWCGSRRSVPAEPTTASCAATASTGQRPCCEPAAIRNTAV